MTAGGSGKTPSSTTTVTIPSQNATTTLFVPGSSATLDPVQAALDDPAKIANVPAAAERLALARELHRLDAFLNGRPKLAPYRAHIWFVAHNSRQPIDARRLAALLWCTVWFPTACS
jgi:hypothetical protein